MDKQTIFAVFYAIFWGGILNMAGRWRMFQPLPYGKTGTRVLLSVALMMVAPIGYFAWAFTFIGQHPAVSVLDVVTAVLPAVMIFAFYRVWMATVQQFPRVFYWSKSELLPDERLRLVETMMEDLQLHSGYGGKLNFVTGVIYGLAAGAGLWLGQ